MTMLRPDSFDFYNTAQISRYWTIISGTPQITSGGRNGTNCLNLNAAAFNSRATVQYSFPANIQEGFIHFALSGKDVVGVAAEDTFLSLLDNATFQLSFVLRADRKIDVVRGLAAGVLLGTTSAPMPAAGILAHFQIRYKIHDTTGIVRILMNDNEVLNLTNVDTQNSANAFATSLRLGVQGGFNNAVSNFLVDDFIFCDTAGAVNNGLLGDKRVKWCPALAEGAQNDYTPSTGTDNAALVDENPANDDTDYIESQTVGHIDYVTISVSPAIPAGSTIEAVAVVTQDKKTDGGTRTFRHKIRFGSGPTIANGGSIGPTTGYEIHKTVFENAITVSEVNAPMQVGVEVMT